MEFVPLFEDFIKNEAKGEKEDESKFKKFVKSLDPQKIEDAPEKVKLTAKQEASLEKIAKELIITRDKIQKQFEKYQNSIKEIAKKDEKVTADLMKTMEKLQVTEYEINGIVVKLTKEHERRSTSYEKIIDFWYEKVDPIMQKYVQKLFLENSKMNTIKSKLELKAKKGLTKLKENNEYEISEGIKDWWNKIVNWVKNSVNSLLGRTNELEDTIKDFDNIIDSELQSA